MISDYAYARPIRAHFLTDNDLFTIILEEDIVNDIQKEHLQQMFTNFTEFLRTFESIKNNYALTSGYSIISLLLLLWFLFNQNTWNICNFI